MEGGASNKKVIFCVKKTVMLFTISQKFLLHFDKNLNH